MNALLLPPRRGANRVAVLLSGLVLAAAAGGCGYTTPAVESTQAQQSAVPTQHADLKANLELAGADPCRLLSRETAAHLGVGSGTQVANRQGLNGKACRLTNFPDKPDAVPGKTFLVQLTTDRRDLMVDDNAATPPIGGFPAVQGTATGTNGDNSCVDVVDLTAPVGSSRFLWIQFANIARDNRSMDHQTACRNAAIAANDAVASLNQASH